MCWPIHKHITSHALADVHEQYNDNTQAYANDNITITSHALANTQAYQHDNLTIILMRWPIRLQKHKHQQCKCSSLCSSCLLMSM